MKYVTLLDPDDRVIVVAFSAETRLSHRDVMQGCIGEMRRHRDKQVDKFVTARSAGFFYFGSHGAIYVSNERSETLDMGPMEGDVDHIRAQLYYP